MVKRDYALDCNLEIILKKWFAIIASHKFAIMSHKFIICIRFASSSM